ncbi:MAG: heavy metal-binding domain-containing protein [Myxococcota bacterium]
MSRFLVLPVLLLVACSDASNPARSAIEGSPAAPGPSAPASEATVPAPATPVDATATPTNAPATAAETWWCPMHPEVTQDHPGKCQKCGGMDLVKKGA